MRERGNKEDEDSQNNHHRLPLRRVSARLRADRLCDLVAIGAQPTRKGSGYLTAWLMKPSTNAAGDLIAPGFARLWRPILRMLSRRFSHRPHNASAHLLPEADARHERTLGTVRCIAWFGAAQARRHA